MEVIGYLMIAGLFTALFALVAIVLGSVLESALIFLGAGALTAWIYAASWLIAGR